MLIPPTLAFAPVGTPSPSRRLVTKAVEPETGLSGDPHDPKTVSFYIRLGAVGEVSRRSAEDGIAALRSRGKNATDRSDPERSLTSQ